MLNLLIITNLQDNLDIESIDYIFFSRIQLELKNILPKLQYSTIITVTPVNH